jgi:hypothetical protein
MINKTGYRQMLRDRLPRYVNDALKWCKVKEAWLDHVYKNFIWIYSNNEERLAETRRVLGYKEYSPREFKFEDTIDWDNLNNDETKRWKEVQQWVSWFTTTVPYIEDDYISYKKKGQTLLVIKQTLMIKWFKWLFPTLEDSIKTIEKKNKDINAILDYLIDCFENRNK